MALEYTFTVAGKRVTLKKRIALKDAPDLIKRVGTTPLNDLQGGVAIMQALIESWEFDGSPSDASAWDALDVFEVVWPLWRKVDQHLGERMKFDPKASAPASSRPSPSGTASTPRGSTS